MSTNNLLQLIQEPTHITLNNSSTLELITNSHGYIHSVGIGTPLGDPYHCLTFCKIKVQKLNKHCKRQIWKHDLGDYIGLNETLASALWETMDIFQEIEDAADYFKQLFLDTCTDFIPTKHIPVRPADEPWITNEVRHTFRKHNRAYKKWKRNPASANCDN